MSSKELSEWQAFYALEPWGEERAEMRNGILASTIANIWRGKHAAFKPKDFIPEYGQEQGKVSSGGGTQTWQDHLAIMRAMTQRQNEQVALEKK